MRLTFSQYALLLFLGLCPAIISAQNVPPPIEWTKTIGGSRHDYGICLLPLHDGGYLIGGSVESDDGDVHGMHHSGASYKRDIYLARLNASGDTIWTRAYGGSFRESITKLRRTTDGGFIFIGSTTSMDGDVSGLHDTPGYGHGVFGYTPDMWVVKIDSLGNILWQKCLGGTGGEGGSDIVVNADGTFLVLGSTNSYDGDVSGVHTDGLVTSYDMWVVKLSATGSVLWQRCYGGSSTEGGYGFFGGYAGYTFAKATPDGGYLLACQSFSSDGDVSTHNPSLDSIPNSDIWLVKIDSSGAILWERTLGGSMYDVPSKVLTFQDGYLLAAITQSTDGDVAGHHPAVGANSLALWDVWLVALDLSGNIVWSKCYGGSSMDEVRDMIQTDEGNVLLVGQTYSMDGDVGPRSAPNFQDAWLFKVDLEGNLLWSKTYGGSLDDDGNAVIQTADGGYAFVGSARSPDGDVGGAHGTPYMDIWVVKLGQDSLETTDTSVHVSYSPTPAIFRVYPTYSQGIVNISASTGIGKAHIFVTDVLGKSYPVHRQQINDGLIRADFSQLPAAGWYFIHCIAENQRYVQKVFYQP